jgi:hypothetical protein
LFQAGALASPIAQEIKAGAADFTMAFHNDLVLVRGKAFPDYSSAMIYNPLSWHSPGPLYARDRSPEVRRQLQAAYPDRRIRVVNGPSVTGRGFELAE